MKEELRILVLEDAPADVTLIDHELRQAGIAFQVTRVETREEFTRELEQNPPDVILSDHGLPTFDGFAALALARSKCPDVPFIFVTGSMGEELAIESLRGGATDYVLKTRMSNLVPAVERALRLTGERTRRRQAEQELRDSEERFRLLVSGVKDYAICMLGPDGRISSWNPGAELVLGYVSSEVLGEHVRCFYKPADRDSGKPERDLRIATDAGRFQEEHWRLRKGSESFWAHVDIRALRDDKGTLRGFTQVLRDATERMRAQEALQESEARKTAILETSLDAIVGIDAAGIVREWNAAAERIFGYRRDQALGRTLESLIAPTRKPDKPQPGLTDILGAPPGTVLGRPLEIRGRRSDGGEFPLELALTQITVTEPPFYTAFMRDITDRKLAEEALRRSEARKSAILESALDAIVTIDGSGRVIEWNPAATEVFGYSRELALGRSFADLLAPRSNEELARKGLPRHLQTGRGRLLGQRMELLALRANGAEFPVELTITHIASGDETVFTSFIRDITERRRTEEALRKSEERFRLLVEGVEDYAIYMLDTHGRVTTWNAGAERLHGYRAQEIIGRRFHRFYSPEDADRRKPDKALAVATSEGRYQDEHGLRRKNGSQFLASLLITALRDEAGKLTGFSAIARDVTKRKGAEDEIHRLNSALERQVQERTAELQAAYNEMEAFSYSISHDLRAPLIHIAGFVDMLKSDLGSRLDDRSRRHLDTISSSTEHMGRMIADLLTLSRIGRAEMHKTRVKLGDLVKDVQRELSAQPGNRVVTWVVGALPEVVADPILMRQVFANLLANALKFTAQRPDARIEVGAMPGDAEDVVFVRDNGVGFDMKYASKLFGVFQRLHPQAEFPGTGVGLAKTRRILQRHGGRVWSESAPGQGATFYFALPRTVAP